MRKYTISLMAVLLAACGTSNFQDETIGFTPDPMDTNPPKPLQCDYPMMACGGPKCVNLMSDRKNCGWCGTECEGIEMCHNYQCVNPTQFGFSEGDLILGPKPYNPVKDLPRPVPH